jgi:hypothetical protein
MKVADAGEAFVAQQAMQQMVEQQQVAWCTRKVSNTTLKYDDDDDDDGILPCKMPISNQHDWILSHFLAEGQP